MRPLESVRLRTALSSKRNIVPENAKRTMRESVVTKADAQNEGGQASRAHPPVDIHAAWQESGYLTSAMVVDPLAAGMNAKVPSATYKL